MKSFIICFLTVIIFLPYTAFGADVYNYKIIKIEREEANIKIEFKVFINGQSLVDMVIVVDPEQIASLGTKAERLAYVKQQIALEIERFKKGRTFINEGKTLEGAEVTLP